MSLMSNVADWFVRKPRRQNFDPNEIKKTIDELRTSSEEMTEKIKNLQQPDILRSLVISMNTTGEHHR